MQPRIALTLFTGNTVGGIWIASAAERAQSLQRHRQIAEEFVIIRLKLRELTPYPNRLLILPRFHQRQRQ